METTTDAASPLDIPVRPLAGPNMRRMVRAARLCEELGHGGDTLGALEELRALRVQTGGVQTLQFLSDVVTAAGLLSHGKTDKKLAQRISDGAYALRIALGPNAIYTAKPAT